MLSGRVRPGISSCVLAVCVPLNCDNIGRTLIFRGCHALATLSLIEHELLSLFFFNVCLIIALNLHDNTVVVVLDYLKYLSQVLWCVFDLILSPECKCRVHYVKDVLTQELIGLLIRLLSPRRNCVLVLIAH